MANNTSPAEVLKPLVGELMGPALMGKTLSLFATGVTTMQCYNYFQFNSSRDQWPIKTFVAFFLSLSLVMAGFHFAYLCNIYMTGSALYTEAAVVEWTRRVATFTIPCFCTCGSQLFFVYRTYQLSKNKLITAGVVMLNVFTFATALYCNSFVWADDVRSVALSTWSGVSSWSGVVTDIILCCTFVWYMWRASVENRGFRKSTDVVIHRILRATLSTTFLTASLTACVAILSRVHPAWMEGFTYLLAPAYLASVTFVLNSRRGLRALVDASLIDGPAIGTSIVARPSCPHTCGGSDHQIPESQNGPSIEKKSEAVNQVDCHVVPDADYDVEKGEPTVSHIPLTFPLPTFQGPSSTIHPFV